MQISNSLASFYALNATSASSLGQNMAASSGSQTPTDSDAAQSAGSGSDSDPSQYFLNYMKETPAQRMQDAWLAAHHLTREDLDAMPPDQRQAIEQQMANDIKNQVEKQAEQQRQSKTDIMA